MRIQWFGQSAFQFTGDGRRVVVDPFVLSGARGSWRFDYPAMNGTEADVLLVTHEHLDHNGVQAVAGTPQTIRSSAGTFESPVGTIVGVASEHDPLAGTQRGANVIFVFTLEGMRLCHLGDFGQTAMRPEQAAAIGGVDMLLVPVGGGPTIGADGAQALVERLRPRWVIPMHYRTVHLNFLEPADAFLDRFRDVRRLPAATLDTADLAPGSGPVVLVPAVPGT